MTNTATTFADTNPNEFWQLALSNDAEDIAWLREILPLFATKLPANVEQPPRGWTWMMYVDSRRMVEGLEPLFSKIDRRAQRVVVSSTIANTKNILIDKPTEPGVQSRRSNPAGLFIPNTSDERRAPAEKGAL